MHKICMCMHGRCLVFVLIVFVFLSFLVSVKKLIKSNYKNHEGIRDRIKIMLRYNYLRVKKKKKGWDTKKQNNVFVVYTLRI